MADKTRDALRAAKQEYMRVMTGAGQYAGQTTEEYIANAARTLAEVRRLEAASKERE